MMTAMTILPRKSSRKVPSSDTCPQYLSSWEKLLKWAHLHLPQHQLQLLLGQPHTNPCSSRTRRLSWVQFSNRWQWQEGKSEWNLWICRFRISFGRVTRQRRGIIGKGTGNKFIIPPTLLSELDRLYSSWKASKILFQFKISIFKNKLYII